MAYDVTAEDRNRISQGLYSYCRGLDRFDRELALSPFAPDAQLVYADIFAGSPAGFMDWVWPIHEALPVHVHRVTNIFIDRGPSGDLVSESYIQVLLRNVADDGSITDFIGNGRYIDRWVEAGGDLVICERDYVRDMARSIPQAADAAASRDPAAERLTWARDASDASYRLLGA